MNKTQEALELAIKRLEKSNFELQGIGNYSCQIYNDKAIEICKQALEQQAEPVAWMHRHEGEITEFNDFKSCDKCEPLYTSPQCLQEQLKRLTDDEIEDIGCRYADLGGDISDWEGFANAIQDKLGVKQNETAQVGKRNQGIN